MPLGTPGGPPARTGTDWLVVVPAWTLVVTLPLGITAAIVYAIHPGPVSGALTLVLGGISAVGVTCLAVAASDGGWTRLRAPFRKRDREEEPDRAEVLAKGPAWKRHLTLAGSLALLGLAGWGQFGAGWKTRTVVKLALVGLSGLWISIDAFRRARAGR
jgi:hypothetical protein